MEKRRRRKVRRRSERGEMWGYIAKGKGLDSRSLGQRLCAVTLQADTDEHIS